MTNKEYFVIYNIEGDTYVTAYTKKELEDEINSGITTFFRFLNNVLPINSNYWEGKAMIIKGEIVVPRDEITITRKVLP